MKGLKLKMKAVKVICNNCFQQTIGLRDETGMIKYRCAKCGTVTISKVMGRRHIQFDMYAPQGQELMDDDSYRQLAYNLQNFPAHTLFPAERYMPYCSPRND